MVSEGDRRDPRRDMAEALQPAGRPPVRCALPGQPRRGQAAPHWGPALAVADRDGRQVVLEAIRAITAGSGRGGSRWRTRLSARWLVGSRGDPLRGGPDPENERRGP